MCIICDMGYVCILFHGFPMYKDHHPGERGAHLPPSSPSHTVTTKCGQIHCAVGQDVEAAEEGPVGPSLALPSPQPPVNATTLPARGGLYQRFRQSFQRIVGLEHQQASAEALPEEGAPYVVKSCIGTCMSC